MGQKYNPSLPFEGLNFLYDFCNINSYPGSGTTLYNLVGPDHLIIDGGPGLASVGKSSYVYCDGSQLIYNDNLIRSFSLQGPLTFSIVYNPIALSGVRINYFSLGNTNDSSQLQYGFPSVVSTVPSIFKGGSTPVSILSHGFSGLGTVVHVTYTVDGSNNSKVYVNGVLTGTSSTALATGTASKLRLNSNTANSDAGDAAYYWLGIWNRALNDREVAEVWHSLKRRWGFEAGTAGTNAGTPSSLALGTQTVNLNYTYATQSFTNEIPAKIYYSHLGSEIESKNYDVSAAQAYFWQSGTANTLCFPFYVYENITANSINWFWNVQSNTVLTATYKIGISEDNGLNQPIIGSIRGETTVTMSDVSGSIYSKSVNISGVALTSGKQYWVTFTSGGSAQTSFSCYMYAFGNITQGGAKSNLVRYLSGVATTDGTFGPALNYIYLGASNGRYYSNFYGQPYTNTTPTTRYYNQNEELGIYLYMPKNHPSLRLAGINLNINAGFASTYILYIRDNLGNLVSGSYFDMRKVGANSSTYQTYIPLDSPVYLHNDKFYAITVAGNGTTGTSFPLFTAGIAKTDFYSLSGNGFTFVPILYDTNQYINLANYTFPLTLYFDKIGYESSSGLSVIQ